MFRDRRSYGGGQGGWSSESGSLASNRGDLDEGDVRPLFLVAGGLGWVCVRQS